MTFIIRLVFYYEVLPATKSYHSNQPLVYKSSQNLELGQIVTIELKNSTYPGLIAKATQEPKFKTKAIAKVYDLPPLPQHLVKLAQWLASFYVSGLGPAVCQIITQNSLLNIKIAANVKLKPVPSSTMPTLTKEQELALAKTEISGTHILHGETGSGKTRVYIELTKKSLARSRSAIILTPEIGLTTQLSQQFQQVFGDKVIIFHSGLTQVERRRAWQNILLAETEVVVIGPRSALFSPVKSLGLIVVDECHDSSYKQGETPHYSATTVAARLAQLQSCPLILGSATPNISDYFLAKRRNRPILRLKNPATGTTPKSTTLKLVDIKDRTNFKRGRYISEELIQAIESALENGEQVLLFLNRRGTARAVLCTACGWTATCPHCNLPLTYHADSHSLRCHTCGYKQTPVTSCPVCFSNELSFRGVAVKAIEAEAKRLFPKARIRRFDTDSPKAERLEQIYDSVKNGDIDIIIGTQTIAKGLDLPKLAVAGVIIADTGLYLPDFTAEERTYQLIRQVIGRVGRGHRQGTAIIQTYSPDNPVIQAALSGDFSSFYQKEMAERQRLHFPPSTHLLKLVIKRSSSASAEKAASALKAKLAASELSVTIEGPTPSFHEISGNKYHWQLIIKSSERTNLVKALELVPGDTTSELDPISLL